MRDVVVAEIRVKLRVRMESEMGPCAIRLEPSELRKPLSREIEVPAMARAFDDLGQDGVPLDIQGQRFPAATEVGS